MNRLPPDRSLWDRFIRTIGTPSSGVDLQPPEGWIMVKATDVAAVTPMQHQFLELDSFPPLAQVIGKVEMQEYVTSKTNKFQGNRTFGNFENVVDAFFLNPSGARIFVNVEKYGGKLKAMTDTSGRFL